MADGNSNGDTRNSFEQYKLYVGSLEKVDDLRARASKLLVILNSAILSAFAYGLFELVEPGCGKWVKSGCGNWKNAWPIVIIIGVTGLALSIVWIRMIRDYKKLYDVKSCVVKALEERMPENVYTRVYTQEWAKLCNKDFSISNWEECLARLFSVLYALILVGGILILLNRCACCSSPC